jgi:two-component system alkaline phosphatase synthesis response regulator PhoP
MNNRILVVDDDPAISRLIEFNLKLAGYDVYCVFDGGSVFEGIKQHKPSLIVLDVMLPTMSGIEVCQKLRGNYNHIPIIMLSALSDTADKIVGLDVGADDYMTKPFSPQELISRVNSVIRRMKISTVQDDSHTIEIGSIRVVPDRREVTVHNKMIDLTPKEFELLLFMCKHKGKVLSRQHLLHGVWDYHFYEDTRIVDVHISHLREKLEADSRAPKYILTIRNVGYKMKDLSLINPSLS